MDRLLLAMLVASFITAGGCASRAPQPSGPQTKRSSIDQIKSHENTRPFQLADGSYHILRRGASRAELLPLKQDETIVDYDKNQDVPNPNPRFLVIHTTPEVPFILKVPPKVIEVAGDDYALHLEFVPEVAQKLAEFTTAHMDPIPQVAAIIANEVVSTHKIRQPVLNGKIMVSCCDPRACDRLIAAMTTIEVAGE